jgi:hypothetical protein
MEAPDSGYMNRALNAWQAMAAQGAGEVAKIGANALGIEKGPPEQSAGEAMSALPGIMDAEGPRAPKPGELATQAGTRALPPEPPPRIEPIPPRLPEPPSAPPAAEPESFVQDYFPHQWQDPKRAAQVGQQIASTARSGAWQGSGRNLKTRTIPRLKDGA